MQITLNQALQDCQAELCFQGNTDNIFFNGAIHDNRLVKQGNLFVCIKGENNDGHNYAHDAVKRGASVILAEKNPFEGQEIPIPVLLVPSSIKALGQLAHKARQRFAENPQNKVIGITGTAGKTSVKELLAHILTIEQDLSSNAKKVAKNLLNYNTQIGMPISILNTTGKEQYWVLELGISQKHDMHELGEILQPDIALVLNAGSGHTEGLGDMGVAYYKAQLLNFVPQNGSAFVSADYPDLFVHAIYNKPDTKFFSCQSKKLPYFAKYQGITENGLGKYILKTPNYEFEVESIFIGEYGAENCIASASIALELGLSIEQIQYAMKTAIPPQMRFNKIQKNTWTIIDDTYNANPLSVIKMIESASELAKHKDFIVLLGEMKELGNIAEQEHQEIGKFLGEKNPLAVFFVGSLEDAIQNGLNQANYQGIFYSIKSTEDFLSKLHSLPLQHKEQLLLVKGSRSNHLENYIQSFVD